MTSNPCARMFDPHDFVTSRQALPVGRFSPAHLAGDADDRWVNTLARALPVSERAN